MAERVLIVGAGSISADYAAALRHVGMSRYDVHSRSEDSARKFAQAHGAERASWGGLARFESLVDQYDRFIIACSIEHLLTYTEILARAGKSEVLVEKPLALNSAEVSGLIARYPGFEPFVALNRLFFPSVMELRRRLAGEPALAGSFSFTEWVHRIDLAKYHPAALDRWGASNCIHVIGTFFDLVGDPARLSPYVGGRGELAWHPAGNVFCGAGATRRGVLFDYHSNWRSAGRWSISVDTERGRYDLSPMETLRFTPKGSIADELLVPAPADGMRAGFPQMLQAWLNREATDRTGLGALRAHLRSIEAMMYPDG